MLTAPSTDSIDEKTAEKVKLLYSFTLTFSLISLLFQVNWVQCNRCSKWRKTSPHIDVDSLPDTWLCEDNTWNTAFAKCSVKEEVDASASSTTTGVVAVKDSNKG